MGLTTEETRAGASGAPIWKAVADGVTINPRAWTAQAERALTPDALALIAGLHRELDLDRRALLAARAERQRAWDGGELPGYLDGEVTEAARADWRVAPLPRDLLRRRVEITGPVNDAKMVINMLSRNEEGARADAAMLDFEDSMKPSWANLAQGVENLIGAAQTTLAFVKRGQGGEADKTYRIDPDDMPLLMVRCRGLHLAESNLLVDGSPVSGGLMDLALAAFHTARVLMAQGKTPKYYVPKVEHHLEARWWNQAFSVMEEKLGVKHGTLKATFLIETLPAAYQMEEILFEIRDHAAGLNVGRWDKIFSDIKTLRLHKDKVLADRASITMMQPWMANYALRCVKVCHSRGAFGMGGMAAFTPGKSKEIRDQQIAKVVADKKHEASIGHDGCWVSHPYFIGPAMSAFTRKNQLDVVHADKDKYPDLLPKPIGPKTMGGLRTNVRVGIGYMEGWLRDVGAVAWDNLMEDLATLEISRAQTWQWLHHEVKLDDGNRVTRDLVKRVFEEELGKIVEQEAAEFAAERGTDRQSVVSSFVTAAKTAESIFTEKDFREFLFLASDPAA